MHHHNHQASQNGHTHSHPPAPAPSAKTIVVSNKPNTSIAPHPASLPSPKTVVVSNTPFGQQVVSSTPFMGFFSHLNHSPSHGHRNGNAVRPVIDYQKQHHSQHQHGHV